MLGFSRINANFGCAEKVWCEMFLINSVSAIAAGLVLGAIFFVLKEKMFSAPRLDGRWYVNVTTEKTSYRPYEGMRLKYVVVLCQEATKLFGSSEKIHEDSSARVESLYGKERSRAVVEGFIEKRIFARDRIVFHILEDGHVRSSTNLHQLVLTRSGLKGKFFSMVADQEGVVSWSRDEA